MAKLWETEDCWTGPSGPWTVDCGHSVYWQRHGLSFTPERSSAGGPRHVIVLVCSYQVNQVQGPLSPGPGPVVTLSGVSTWSVPCLLEAAMAFHWSLSTLPSTNDTVFASVVWLLSAS